MAVVDFTRTVSAGAEQTWARLTDFPAHGRFVPLTTVRLLEPGLPGGGGFVARTQLAGLGFDDVNVLDEWRPPADGAAGVCRLHKTGRWVRGGARLSVTPALHGSVVRWQEDLDLFGVPALLDPFVAWVGTRTFGRLVDGLMS